MLFEFYWLGSCCLSPFTSQWARRWPLCCLGALYIIGPNTIKCTFSIRGSKWWQPLRCPHAHTGPTPVTSNTWTMTLIYKQVTSATTAFMQGQLGSLYFTEKKEKGALKSRRILIIEWRHDCTSTEHKKRVTAVPTHNDAKRFLLEKQIQAHGASRKRGSWSECSCQRWFFFFLKRSWMLNSSMRFHTFFFLLQPHEEEASQCNVFVLFPHMSQISVLETCFNQCRSEKSRGQKNAHIAHSLKKEYINLFCQWHELTTFRPFVLLDTVKSELWWHRDVHCCW